MNTVSQILRKKRMEKGFSQKEMANVLKISPPAYSKYESGKTNISIDIATKFAEALQIPLSELLDGKSGNIEIKNVSNSAISNENATINLQNDKLTDAILLQNDQFVKMSEQLISVMQNQNELFKEMVKVLRR